MLRIIRDHAQQLELDPEVFDLVYEGFWDLYTFQPKLRDVSARKLQTWIQKIILKSGAERDVQEDQNENKS